MIRALIFDCFGVLILDSVIGPHRDQELFDYVAELRTTYPVALLSNISPAARDACFTSEELTRYFDIVVISGEEGIAKPEPDIFLRVVRRLGCQPHEVVMIDDNVGHCAGARQAGLHAIQYRSLRQLKAELSALANPE